MLNRTIILYAILFLLLPVASETQEGLPGSDWSPPKGTLATCTNPEFGTYCYMHKFLHEHGVVQDLIEKSGKSCCDGGTGGECRVTLIRRGHEGWSFLHGDTWCALGVNVRFDVRFPPAVRKAGVNAVVCASGYIVNGCPNGNYCAAIDFQPG